MSVNDTICKLAQLLGLKDTQEETVLKKKTSLPTEASRKAVVQMITRPPYNGLKTVG